MGSRSLTGSSGQPMQLGQKLGEGGEGAVYEIAGRPELAAKVYRSPLTHEKAEKLTIMVAMRTESLRTVAAWPLDLLRSHGAVPRGFVMPRIRNHVDIHTLYTPKSRKDTFPEANWKFLVHVAANVARAIGVVHESDCVVGDINHGSILVSPKATTKLIDCDSFQISGRGRRFFCEVGVPTYTPPELQGKPFNKMVRTKNHDAFGLAVLIFHLLFMGRHPFAGKFVGVGDMPIERAIREFRFAYGSSKGLAQMQPAPHSLPMEAASQPVALLFERAFSREAGSDGIRPTARQWIHALEELERRLRVCPVNASHHYLASLPSCPWCRMEAATGAVMFAVYIRHGPAGVTFNVAAVWARIAAVESPGPGRGLPSKSGYVVKPSLQARKIAAGRRVRTVGAWAIVGVALAAIVAGHVPAVVAFWVFVGSVIAAVSVKKSGADSRDQFVKAFRAAEGNWATLRTRWEQDASDRAFRAELEEFGRVRSQWEELPRRRQERYRELENERKMAQLRRFLESYSIDRASIPGIGPTRKAMLEIYGIDTAGDVIERAVMAVPGFGVGLAGNLLNWRRSIEAKFRFDPTKSVDPRDIAALDREIADARQMLEARLLSGEEQLKEIRTRILKMRAEGWQKLEASFVAFLSAEADKNKVGV